MPIRSVGPLVVQTSVTPVQGGFRVALYTRAAQGPAHLQEWPIPNHTVYESAEQAERWAHWILLGVSGIEDGGSPILSVC